MPFLFVVFNTFQIILCKFDLSQLLSINSKVSTVSINTYYLTYIDDIYIPYYDDILGILLYIIQGKFKTLNTKSSLFSNSSLVKN